MPAPREPNRGIFSRDLRQRQLPRTIDIPSQVQPSGFAASPGDGENGGADSACIFRLRRAWRNCCFRRRWTRKYGSGCWFPMPFPISTTSNSQYAVRGHYARLRHLPAIDWPGLSTAIATCIITALSTIGCITAKAISSTGRSDHWRLRLRHGRTGLRASLS